MIEVCFSDYAKCIQKALQPPNDDLSTVTLLLEWITHLQGVTDKKGEPICIDAPLTSNLLKRKVNVPKAIKDACSSNEIISLAISHFQEKITPLLNPIVSDDMYESILNAIKNDSQMARRNKAKYIKWLDAENEIEFLANFLLYVINRENRIIGKSVDRDDIPLLAEVDFRCPICHKQLIEQIKNSTIKKYDIVQIFPDNRKDIDLGTDRPIKIDAPINLIALCRDHAEEYIIEPTKELYDKLTKLKRQTSTLHACRIDINDASLDDEIKSVLVGLANIPQNAKLEELPLEALRLDQKILPENSLLLNDEMTRVLRYYHYIENIFSSMERDGTGNFNLIASEISVAYQKLSKSSLSQEEIVNELADWIKNKSGVGDKNIRACHIVVAYFIQNCEVFDEISK
ncbi:MAG: ABC-three component system protein [Oscillospiraceae bacterium]